MLESVDLTALEVKSFSGADAGSKFDLPERPAAKEAPKEEVLKKDVSKKEVSKEECPKEKELKEYHGNCHCGAVRFSVKMPELKEVSHCNCSHCTRVCIPSTTGR